ncbi:hypothetical protein EVAR_44800_1 [Eumeta japonica]|uniref:Histone-lysine N-methyltransferase SETMAR n=1 Tax=Eumeta variegata TaxID=151549 RepID=A0A4C1XBR0_EUMVA|nr:hypothetical protein EVAR_44800_1 [Eumeta japonica]
MVTVTAAVELVAREVSVVYCVFVGTFVLLLKSSHSLGTGSLEFKSGRVNLSDVFCDSRPSTTENNKSINAVRRMIKTERHVTYYELRAPSGIGMSKIRSILYKHLGVKKLCSHWIPHNLT